MIEMPIGAYIAKRRASAALSIDDVAFIFTDPTPAAEALRAIEAGETAPTIDDLATIADIVPMDLSIAAELLAGRPAEACRVCGCSWDDPCMNDKDGSCWWVADALCSHCPPPAPDARA